MIKISFTTNGSYRVYTKIRYMVYHLSSISSGIGSRRRDCYAEYDGTFEDIKEKLKLLKCTNIKQIR